MIKDINAITPEYMKHRIEEETEQYKQEIERLNNKVEELDTKWINSLQQEEEYEEGWKELKEIIDEAREYINRELLIKYKQDFELIEILHIKKILEILDKGEE